MNMERMQPSTNVERVVQPEGLTLSEIGTKLHENNKQSSLIGQRIGDEKNSLSIEDYKKNHEELYRLAMEGSDLLDQRVEKLKSQIYPIK